MARAKLGAQRGCVFRILCFLYNHTLSRIVYLGQWTRRGACATITKIEGAGARRPSWYHTPSESSHADFLLSERKKKPESPLAQVVLCCSRTKASAGDGRQQQQQQQQLERKPEGNKETRKTRRKQRNK